MFKELSAMASLLKQANTIGPKMEAVMAELKEKQTVGEAGGGMVRVTADGLGQIQQIEFDPVIIEKNDWEMASVLLPAAINQAVANSKQLHLEAMKDVTGDLALPGNMDEMLKNFMGKS